MIAVVDYGLGNLRSVVGALEFLGARVSVTHDPGELLAAEKLVLPGVGSFRAAMEKIDERALRAPLLEAVRVHGKPILGICLGMQILAESGDEDGPTDGLGLIAGRVERLATDAPSLAVPHIGFNTATFRARPGSLFDGLGASADFYFIHSYRMICADDEDVSSVCDYGGPFTASVQRGHIYGTQFHPEKSQTNGLRVLERFVATSAPC